MIIFSFFYSFIIIFGVLSKITLAVKLQQCVIQSSGDGAPVACTESGAVKGYKGDNNIAIFKGWKNKFIKLKLKIILKAFLIPQH